jgi:hypothetical protein
MTWNPKAAQPEGCAGSLPAGAGGTLDAVAMSDGESSPVRSFKMESLETVRVGAKRRPSPAVPIRGSLSR